MNHAGVGTGRGAFSERTDPKEVETERFAHILAEDLNKARAKHLFEKLIIIAPPHFHGLIKKYCHHHVLACISHNIEKDYTQSTEKELIACLKELDR
jgi:protein required for attachment to host cells